MGLDSINRADQSAQLWQYLVSAMDSSLSGTSDSSAARAEGIGQFLGRMEQLRSTGSSQLQAVLGEIASQLQGTALQSEGTVQELLGLMAGGFQSASTSDDLAMLLSGDSSSQNSLDAFFSMDGNDPFLAALTANVKSMGTAGAFQQLLAWREAQGTANDIINSVLKAQGV